MRETILELKRGIVGWSSAGSCTRPTRTIWPSGTATRFVAKASLCGSSVSALPAYSSGEKYAGGAESKARESKASTGVERARARVNGGRRAG